jgi:hypothetical protein
MVPAGTGGTDFDRIYADLIAPAVADAGLEPLRTNPDQPLYDAALLCRFAVIDLTEPGPTVAYALGVRHGSRPYTTVCTAAESAQQIMPNDAVRYKLDPDGRPDPTYLATARGDLTAALNRAKAQPANNPLFQLLDGPPPTEVEHLKTDLFLERVPHSVAPLVPRNPALFQSRDLFALAHEGAVADDTNPISPGAPDEQQSLERGREVESGVLVRRLLACRGRKAWDDMIRLVGNLPRSLQETALVREQYALALNRAGRRTGSRGTAAPTHRGTGPEQRNVLNPGSRV